LWANKWGEGKIVRILATGLGIAPIRRPAAWQRSGLFSTEYGLRYDAAGELTKVSLARAGPSRR
jgi:hypothetical protein